LLKRSPEKSRDLNESGKDSQEAPVVIDGWGTNPMMIELLRRMQDTQVFLRMAGLELRRIADQELHIAAEVRQVAQKLEAEAEDPARRNTE
jgi:hypothetical protein